MADATYTVMVTDDKAGLRLDRLLAVSLAGISRSAASGLIAAGRVAGPGAAIASDPDRRVRTGDIFVVSIPEPQAPALVPRPADLTIVYEDEAILVVDKPAGLVVHPGAGTVDATLVNALLAHGSGALAPAGGALRPGIVHRLDKDTSGLIVVARTDRAYHGLVAQFSRHTVERCYWAVVWGVPVPPAGRIAAAIGRSPADRKKMATVARGGKAAATRYETIAAFGASAALVACRPETGRTHQIRVHMAAIGHPLVGDATYGGRRARRRASDPVSVRLAAFPRHALHARFLAFRHPENDLRLQFESEVPPDFNELLNFLKKV